MITFGITVVCIGMLLANALISIPYAIAGGVMIGIGAALVDLGIEKKLER